MSPHSDTGPQTERGAERKESTMEAPDIRRTATLLLTLEELDDHALHAVLTRAQGLLLDRPDLRESALTVEIVDREESGLLAVYRGLAPVAQRCLAGQARQLGRAHGRQHQDRPWLDLTPAGTQGEAKTTHRTRAHGRRVATSRLRATTGTPSQVAPRGTSRLMSSTAPCVGH